MIELPSKETIARFTLRVDTKPAEPKVSISLKQQREAWVAQGLTARGTPRKRRRFIGPNDPSSKELQRRRFVEQGLTTRGKPRVRIPDSCGIIRQLRGEGFIPGTRDYWLEYRRRYSSMWRKRSKT